MPKVGKHTLNLSQKDGYGDFEVWYNSKEGFYYKGFPDHMREFLRGVDNPQDWPTTFRTEDALKTNTEAMIRRYYEVTQTERHVIVIRLALSKTVYSNKRKHESGGTTWSGYKDWALPHKDIIIDADWKSMDYAIGLEYDTGIILTGKETRFIPTKQDEEGKIIKRSEYGQSMQNEKFSKAKIMDYSVDLELFLGQVQKQMERLAERMLGFFGDDTRLLGAAQNQIKLITM